MVSPQTLPAEDEAAPLLHAAGPFQETGSSVPGAAQREHPSRPDLGPASSRDLRDAGSTDRLQWEEEPAAAGPVRAQSGGPPLNLSSVYSDIYWLQCFSCDANEQHV